MVKNPPTMQETWIWSLDWKDPLEKGKANHSSILAWRIPWASMRAQLVKNPPTNAGNPTSIPELGRSAGEGIGYQLQYSWASLVVQQIKNPPAVRVDLGSIPGLERYPGEEKSYPLQYSGLENSMDSPWGHKELDMTEWLSIQLIQCVKCSPYLKFYKK